ncbi:MAG: hypothetical protein AAF581_02065 [Planctomycetota bacterium]
MKLLREIFFEVTIQRALFNAYLVIFLVTAAVTLAGIANILTVDPTILEKLIYLVIAEVAAGLVALFHAFFLSRSDAVALRLQFEEPLDMKGLVNASVTCAFVNSMDPRDDDNADMQQVRRVLDDGGPLVKVSPPKNADMVHVSLESAGVPYAGSVSLNSRGVELLREEGEGE